MPNHDNEDLKHYHLKTSVISTPGSGGTTKEILLFKYTNTSKKRTVHEKAATIADLKERIKEIYNFDAEQAFFLTWKGYLLEPDELKIRDIGVPNSDGTYDRIKIFDSEFFPVNVNLYAKPSSIPTVVDLSADVEDDDKSVYGDDEEEEEPSARESSATEAGATEAELSNAVLRNSGYEFKDNSLIVSSFPEDKTILFEGESPLFSIKQVFPNADALETHIKQSKLIKTYQFQITILKKPKFYIALIKLLPRKKGGNKKTKRKSCRRSKSRKSKTRRTRRRRKYSVFKKTWRPTDSH